MFPLAPFVVRFSKFTIKVTKVHTKDTKIYSICIKLVAFVYDFVPIAVKYLYPYHFLSLCRFPSTSMAVFTLLTT